MSTPQLPFPLLSPQYPLGTESVIPKYIAPSSSQHVKIRTKGLSRHNAQVWEGSGKTCINDEPGKSGLSFDLIFSRLQGEVQKSKDIGAELQNLTTALDEIQDTLGGLLNMPPPLHSLPPVRPPQVQQPQCGEQQPSSSAGVIATHNGPPPDGGPGHPPPLTEMLLEIEAQRQDVQSPFSSFIDQLRSLESMLAKCEALRQEKRVLLDLMKARHLEYIDKEVNGNWRRLNGDLVTLPSPPRS
ncbi:hypothetical protein JOM56_009261 [Amanita muscaria]